VESPTGLRTLSSDHVTVAPGPPPGDPAWARAQVARTHFQSSPPSNTGGTEYVFERFVAHKFDDDGNLFLQVRWFGFRSKDDTWKLATSLPRESVRKYGKRARIKLPGLTPLGNLLFGNRKAIPRRAPKISRVPKEPEGTTVTGQEPTSKGLGQPPDWTTERERAQPV